MMKVTRTTSRRLCLSTCAVALLAAAEAGAHGNPREEVRATVHGKAVAVEYGRPSLRGRDMLAKLADGGTWRMGADAPTTLDTAGDLAFGDVAVPGGQYVLTLKKAEGRFLLVFSRDGRAVAEAPLEEAQTDASVEMLTIKLAGGEDGGQFSLSWGGTRLTAPFTAP